MVDFRKVFSLEAVARNFIAIGYRPVRGTYHAQTIGSRYGTCLLGSFEHALLGRNGYGKDIAKLTGLPERTLKFLEGGWETSGWQIYSAGGFNAWEAVRLSFDGESPSSQDEADAFEWGNALSRILVDGHTRGLSRRDKALVNKAFLKKNPR